MDQIPVFLEETVLPVRQVPSNLFHPGVVGFWDDSHDSYFPCRQPDHEQHMVANQSPDRPNLRGEEICRRQNIPVTFEELRPGHPFLSLRRRFDPCFFENPSDGAATNVMPEIE